MDICSKKDLNKFLAKQSKFDYLYVTPCTKDKTLSFPGVKWLEELEINVETGQIVEFPDLELVASDVVLNYTGGTIRLPKLQEVGQFFKNPTCASHDLSKDFSCLAGSGSTDVVLDLPEHFLSAGQPYVETETDLNRWFPIANDSQYVLSYNPVDKRVKAGCRYFTIDEGIRHWKEVAEDYCSSYNFSDELPARGNRAVMFVFALTNLKAELQKAEQTA